MPAAAYASWGRQPSQLRPPTTHHQHLGAGIEPGGMQRIYSYYVHFLVYKWPFFTCVHLWCACVGVAPLNCCTAVALCRWLVWLLLGGGGSACVTGIRLTACWLRVVPSL